MVPKGDYSEEVPVTLGFPQGSVLRPVLFLIYINDLPDKVKLFADDTAAYLAINKLADSEQLQADLDILQEWEITWDMQFNPSKCKVIHITRSRSLLPTKYTLRGETLEAVTSARYLGVDIASDLSWKTHISRITETSDYDQEILQTQSADEAVVLWGRATQQSRDTRKTNKAKQLALSSPSIWLQN